MKKTRFLSFLLLAGTMFLNTAFAQGKVLYLAPNSISPDGQYVLAAYEQKTQHDGWESNVAFYLSKVQADGSLKIASDALLDWGGETVDIRGYGPYSAGWYLDRNDAQETIGGYAVIENLSRKSNLFIFAKLENGSWKKQAYKDKNYESRYEKVIADTAKQQGIVYDELSLHDSSTFLTADEESNETQEYISYSFEKPLYVKTHRGYFLYNKDDDKLSTWLDLTSVVKIEKDASGNLVDTLISIDVSIADNK